MRRAIAFLLFVVGACTAHAQEPLTSAISNAGLNFALPTGFASGKQNVPFGTNSPGNASGGGIITITNGGSPYTCTVTTGSLPTGGSIAGSAQGCPITGTPTGTGASAFTIHVTDSSTPAKSLFIATSISVATLSSVAITGNLSISATGTTQLTVTGTFSDTTTFDLTRVASISWSSGTTSCATISALGLVTGANPGSNCSTTITATFHGVSNTASVAVTGSGTTVIISTTSVPDSLQFVNYTPFQFVASGGTPPYTWSVTAGAFPTGLSLSSNGVLTGNCTTSVSTQAVTVHLADSASHTANTSGLTSTCASPSSVGTPTCALTTLNVGSTTTCDAVVTYSDSNTANLSQLSAGGASISVVQVCQAIDDNAANLYTTFTLTLSSPCAPTTANNLVYVDVREGSNNTDAFTVTGFTQTTEGNQAASTAAAIGSFFRANSPSLSSVTVNFSTGGGIHLPHVILYEVAGIVTSSPQDQGNKNGTSGATNASIQSLGITNSNAADINFFYVGLGADQQSWTPNSGWILPGVLGAANSSSNARGASEYQIENATGAFQPTMAWNNATAASQNSITDSFKAASTGGSSFQEADVSGGPSVFGVDHSGKVTAQNAGTGNLKGCVNATCSGNLLITVNGSVTDNMLVVTANGSSTPSCSVGAQLQFKAVGNVTNNDYTSTAHWSTGNSNVATIAASGGLATCGPNTGTVQVNASFP